MSHKYKGLPGLVEDENGDAIHKWDKSEWSLYAVKGIWYPCSHASLISMEIRGGGALEQLRMQNRRLISELTCHASSCNPRTFDDHPACEQRGQWLFVALAELSRQQLGVVTNLFVLHSIRLDIFRLGAWLYADILNLIHPSASDSQSWHQRKDKYSDPQWIWPLGWPK